MTGSDKMVEFSKMVDLPVYEKLISQMLLNTKVRLKTFNTVMSCLTYNFF